MRCIAHCAGMRVMRRARAGIYNFVTKRGLCHGAKSKISWTQVWSQHSRLQSSAGIAFQRQATR